MNRLRPSTCLVCVTLLVACTQLPDRAATDADAVAGIREHNVAVEHALTDGDIDALMAEIVDDAVWMPPDQAPIVGKPAIRSFYEALFEQVTLAGTLSPDNQELQIFGDWAVLRGVLVGTVTPKAGGEPKPFANKFVNVLRREPDGAWKHVWDVWNAMSAAELER